VDQQVEKTRERTRELERRARRAAELAHDLNNLLLTILGNAELARREPDLPPGAGRLLERVREAGGRAADLTRRLLECTLGEPEPAAASAARACRRGGTAQVVDGAQEVPGAPRPE
jgi:signal transduction histidine kinase